MDLIFELMNEDGWEVVGDFLTLKKGDEEINDRGVIASVVNFYQDLADLILLVPKLY